MAEIENLVGSSYNDLLIGNAGDNFIFGVPWADVIAGGNGLDVVTLGAGNDIFVAEVGTTRSALKSGTMSVDIITDFDALGDDLIDLSGLDQLFQFRGSRDNKHAGDLTIKTYGNVNAAENALGFDIDGNPGASNISGPVTVVYGNHRWRQSRFRHHPAQYAGRRRKRLHLQRRGCHDGLQC